MQMMNAVPTRIENPPENGIRTTWLGHASVLFQLDNVNILVNPNFNTRGIKYYHPGMNLIIPTGFDGIIFQTI